MDEKAVVLVTDGEFRRGEATFTASDLACRIAPSEESALAAAIREGRIRYVIVGNRPYAGPLYDALPPGGTIARFGVGHDGIDKKQATAKRLLCTNTPGVLDQSVAEHAMLLIIAAARNLIGAQASMANGSWTSPAGHDLHGQRLAVIGCGGIGRALARIASLGFGMRVVGCTRPGAPIPAALEHFESVTNDFAAAVSAADFVSLHMPANAETLRFLNRNRLASLSANTWLINTARGAIVDESALFDSLAEGRLAGAALDVFTHEPYVPIEPSRDLRSLPNVLLTPHVGSNTVESNRRMAERALQNVRFAMAGKLDQLDLLNPGVLQALR